MNDTEQEVEQILGEGSVELGPIKLMQVKQYFLIPRGKNSLVISVSGLTLTTSLCYMYLHNVQLDGCPWL